MLSNKTNKIVGYDRDESDKIHEQLQEILQWLDQNPYINAWRDLENLFFFLRCCKFDLERTKKKIKGFYQMRAERNEWFANRDPFLTEIQDILKLGVFLPIDGTDEKNRKIVIIRTAAHDPKIHTQNNVFKVSKMILDLVLKFEPESCAHGIVAIFDMQNVQLGHALQLNPKLIKRSVHSWTAYPCQPKLLEFVNSPRHVNLFLNTFRLFMTAKMRSRLIIQKHCSVQCPHLAKDLGGNGPTYQELTLKWKKIVEENADFFRQNEQYKMILNK